MALKFAVNNSLSEVTSLPTAIPTGSMTLLQTQTASSSSTIDFTSNIDSTYDSYVFKFINIHPQNDSSSEFRFNMSTDSGSNYNVTKTTTHFISQHAESDAEATLEYRSAGDLAQGTGFQPLTTDIGNDADQSTSGYLHLFNPSSTTFVKHFISNFQQSQRSNYSISSFVSGYGNTTSAVNGIQFKFESGNIDSGVIKLYGIS
jgi:hypothetical protein